MYVAIYNDCTFDGWILLLNCKQHQREGNLPTPSKDDVPFLGN